MLIPRAHLLWPFGARRLERGVGGGYNKPHFSDLGALRYAAECQFLLPKWRGWLPLVVQIFGAILLPASGFFSELNH